MIKWRWTKRSDFHSTAKADIIPVGTSRRIGKYIVSTVVELAEPDEPPYVTVADCGHCFEDVGETG